MILEETQDYEFFKTLYNNFRISIKRTRIISKEIQLNRSNIIDDVLTCIDVDVDYYLMLINNGRFIFVDENHNYFNLKIDERVINNINTDVQTCGVLVKIYNNVINVYDILFIKKGNFFYKTYKDSFCSRYEKLQSIEFNNDLIEIVKYKPIEEIFFNDRLKIVKKDHRYYPGYVCYGQYIWSRQITFRLRCLYKRFYTFDKRSVENVIIDDRDCVDSTVYEIDQDSNYNKTNKTEEPYMIVYYKLKAIKDNIIKEELVYKNFNTNYIKQYIKHNIPLFEFQSPYDFLLSTTDENEKTEDLKDAYHNIELSLSKVLYDKYKQPNIDKIFTFVKNIVSKNIHESRDLLFNFFEFQNKIVIKCNECNDFSIVKEKDTNLNFLECNNCNLNTTDSQLCLTDYIFENYNEDAKLINEIDKHLNLLYKTRQLITHAVNNNIERFIEYQYRITIKTENHIEDFYNILSFIKTQKYKTNKLKYFEKNNNFTFFKRNKSTIEKNIFDQFDIVTLKELNERKFKIDFKFQYFKLKHQNKFKTEKRIIKNTSIYFYQIPHTKWIILLEKRDEIHSISLIKQLEFVGDEMDFKKPLNYLLDLIH